MKAPLVQPSCRTASDRRRLYAVRLAPGEELAAIRLSLAEAVAWCTTYNGLRQPGWPVAVIVESRQCTAAA